MFGLFKRKKINLGCDHFFREDSRELVSEETDWSCFDGNRGSEPDYFKNWLVKCTCVYCGHTEKFKHQTLG